MNWLQVEAYLKHDDRCCVPLGCTEQHGALSLSVDSILAERVAEEAASAEGIPVFPVLSYSPTPSHSAYPGTVSIRLETLLAVVRDILMSLHRTGFRRVMLVNGHGGNTAVRTLAQEVMSLYPELSVKLHNWWQAPATSAMATQIESYASHANWFENFPWTRVESGTAQGDEKPIVDTVMLDASPPDAVRRLIQDGTYGGPYSAADEKMLQLWKTGVNETRDALIGPWAAAQE